jgi:hypothetical protein
MVVLRNEARRLRDYKHRSSGAGTGTYVDVQVLLLIGAGTLKVTYKR